jgi:hypothetical protein
MLGVYPSGMALCAVLLCKTMQSSVYRGFGQLWNENVLSPPGNWLYLTWYMPLIVNDHVFMSYLLMGNEALEVD